MTPTSRTMRTARTIGACAAATFAVLSIACQSTASLIPSSSNTQDASAAAEGTSLKATVPSALSPSGNVTTSSLTPTLVASGATLKYSAGTPQYRYRVTDETGTLAADSGLQSALSWTVPAPLTPTSKYTWTVRAEFRGLVGTWSAPATFSTPVAPADDFGAWESTCQGIADRTTLVVCVWNFVQPKNSVGDLEVAKRVAWLLRREGGGLLLKGSGENVVPWLGMSFSASRVCFPDGHIFKIISDAGPGGANSPGWGDNDFVDKSLYVAAIDPRLK